MIRDAHVLRTPGFDVVIAFVETYGRKDTEAQLGDLEIIPQAHDRIPRRRRSRRWISTP